MILIHLKILVISAYRLLCTSKEGEHGAIWSNFLHEMYQLGHNKNLIIEIKVSGLIVVAYRSRQKGGLGCDVSEHKIPSLLHP